jgi:hypothetical protein
MALLAQGRQNSIANVSVGQKLQAALASPIAKYLAAICSAAHPAPVFLQPVRPSPRRDGIPVNID